MTEFGIRVEVAAPEHVASLLDFYLAMSKEIGDKVSDDLKDQWLVYTKKSAERGHVFRAMVGRSSQVGYAVIRDTDVWPQVPPRVVYLSELYVAEHSRRDGIGRRLLASCINVARRGRHYRMELEIPSDLEGALSLFDDEGFQVVEHTDDQVLLSLNLEKGLSQPVRW